MDPQNTITFHAEIPQSDTVNGENLFLWDNYGSPFDDFFVYQPPCVQTKEVSDASAATNLKLLSSSLWNFSLPDLSANLDLSSAQGAGVAIAAEYCVNSNFHNGSMMSVLQNHPTFQSIQGTGATVGSNVNKNDARNAHLQNMMLHSKREQSGNGKLNEYYLWKMYRDDKTRKVLAHDQYKRVSNPKYSKLYREKKLKQLAVLTKENATLKYQNKLYKEEVKRLYTMKRGLEEGLSSVMK